MRMNILCADCGASVTVKPQQHLVFCSACGSRIELNVEGAQAAFEVPIDQASAGDNEQSASGSPSAEEVTTQPTIVKSPVQRAVVVVPLSAVLGGVLLLLVLTVGGIAWWMNASRKNTGDLEQDLSQAGQEMKRTDQPASDSKKMTTSDLVVAESAESEGAAAKQQALVQRPSPAAVADPIAVHRSRTEIIELLRRVTVFIRVRTSEGIQTGSGFLFRKDDDAGVVVTNAHVVASDDRSTPRVTCVFNSGMEGEISLPGHVMGKDEPNDLAFIHVRHSNFPDPLDLSANATIQETSTVLAAGYPFGEALGTGQRNPAITITQGSVSSLRRDDLGEIVVVQIDGGINSGNSGGPVVDEQGRLVGVAVAKVAGTNIGFAIPKRILESAGEGRATAVTFEKKNFSLDEDLCFFNVELTDPISNIESGQLILFDSKNQVEDLRSDDGAWVKASEDVIAEVSLSRYDSILRGQCQLVPLQKSVQCQVRLDFGSDRVPVWTRPFEVSHRTAKGLVRSVPGTGREFGEMIESVREIDNVAELPATMTDFAINPKTGEIGCVGYATNSAFLIPAEPVGKDTEQAAPKETQLKGKPFRMIYKEYGAQQFFVVACYSSPEVHLLDAETFALVKTVHCECQRVHSLASSKNNEDPFLYYEGMHAGHSFLGVIDLRQMLDLGNTSDHVKPNAVSFQGDRLYLHSEDRVPFCETRSLLSGFSAARPTLTRYSPRFKFDAEKHPFVCVPSGRFVVNGSRVLSPGLRKELAELEFDSLCCFRQRPILVGLSGSEAIVGDPRQLCIASSNSFESVGKKFRLPRELMLWGQLKIGDRTDEMKSLSTICRTRVLADDLRDQVVVAVGNRLSRLPLDRFELPAEEMLDLNLYSADFVVGEGKEIKIGLVEGKAFIGIPKLLDGMKRTADGIRWQPSTKHVGRHSFPVKVTKGDQVVSFDLEFNVCNPSFQVPFEVAGFVVDPKLQFLFCWSRHVARRGEVRQPGNTVAVVPYQSDGESRTADINYEIKDVVLVGGHAAVIPDARNPLEVVFYDLQSLKSVHRLTLKAPVREMRVEQDRLLLILDGFVDRYDANTLDLIDSVAIVDTDLRAKPILTGRTSVWRDGILEAGLLYNADCTELKLMIAAGKFLALEGAEPSLLSGGFLRRLAKRVENPRGFLPTNIPNTQIYASPHVSIVRERMDGTTFGDNIHADLNVMDGERNLRSTIRIAVAERDVGQKTQYTPCRFAGDEFLVGFGERIYRWSTKAFLYDVQILGIRRPIDPGDLHFIPMQSAFVASEPTTVLKHTIAGGTPPYTVSLADGLQGLSFDSVSHDVTLSRQAVLTAAAPMLRALTEGVNQDDWLDRLRLRASELADDFHQHTRKSVSGFPVAVPVCINATDSAGGTCKIQYFVLADLPFSDVIDQLQ